MDFVEYSEANYAGLDMSTRSALNELEVRFGRVEIRELDGECCVRIMTEVGGMEVPMAAIGNTIRDAATRLLQVLRDNK